MLIVGLTRICVAILVVFVLVLTFVGRISVGDTNPFDYFGYFTNQTSLLASIVFVATGSLMVAGRPVPSWLMSARGVAAACLVVVAVIYNVLVPGTGTAPAWVSAVLHVGFPLFVLGDWLIVGDRAPLPGADYGSSCHIRSVGSRSSLFAELQTGGCPTGSCYPSAAPQRSSGIR